MMIPRSFFQYSKKSYTLYTKIYQKKTRKSIDDKFLSNFFRKEKKKIFTKTLYRRRTIEYHKEANRNWQKRKQLRKRRDNIFRLFSLFFFFIIFYPEASSPNLLHVSYAQNLCVQEIDRYLLASSLE